MNTSAYTGRAASSLRVSNQCETGTAGHEAEGIAYLKNKKIIIIYYSPKTIKAENGPAIVKLCLP